MVVADWGAYSGVAGSREIFDGPAARALCAELESQGLGRVLVTFGVADGPTFTIGLGAEDSCAAYWESADPPYYESVGSLPADALIDYAYDTQHSELPGTVRIPKSLALDGLAEFVETGRRPSCITWTET